MTLQSLMLPASRDISVHSPILALKSKLRDALRFGMRCFACVTAIVTAVFGTVAAEPASPGASSTPTEDVQKLLEGDGIRIAFAGAPNFNSDQKIRSDGKITLPIIGDVQAAGSTTLELQKALTERYAKELINPEVTVSLVASDFPVYVTGAVANPGEIRCDRPITVWEAIMKAGGFDPMKAKLESVSIIPRKGKKRTVNLRLVMDGKAQNEDFVSAFDTIVVPDKKIWF